MASAHYICVMCLNTGAPWSEDKLGRTDFPSFMKEKFKFGSECVPLQCQDAEFCCAFPSRNGSNSMLKGPDAGTRTIGCEKICREGGRVIIAVRGVKAPSAWTNAKCDVYNPFLHEPAQNFWFFVPTSRLSMCLDIRGMTASHYTDDGHMTCYVSWSWCR